MTFTKERIIEELKASTQNASGMFEINEDTICALMELLESRADAEPVAYRDRKECNGIRFADGFDYGKLADGAPLYTAPPAPVVVPDDVSGPLAHAYKELTPTFMHNHIDGFERYGIYPDGSAGIQAMRIALDGITRRAAMLQGKAEPVSQPYTLRVWIPCIERMPAKGQEVLCTDQFENYETALYDTGYIPGPPFFATTAGEFHPTHWMPLPAPPLSREKISSYL